MTTRYTTTAGLFRRATSLLEVVIATGIIAAGVAVTLPAVGTIRDSSLSLTCKDHMRTLGQAHMGFSLDNMNRFVGYGRLIGNQPAWMVTSWVHILNYKYFGDEWIGSGGGYSFSYANSGTIRWVGNPTEMEHIKDQIWCPSLRSVSLSSFRCYPMNGYAGRPNNEDSLVFKDTPIFSYYYTGVKTSKYKNPSNSVLHHEAIAMNDWLTKAGTDQPLYLIDSLQDRLPGAASTTGMPSSGTSAINWHFRHNNRMNMLYMDSHVATEVFASEGLNTAERYRYDN